MAETEIFLGTGKGTFILQSRNDRTAWQVRGPFCGLQPINHVIKDPANGAIYAAGGSQWEGACVWRSLDHGESWTKHDNGLAYPDDRPKLDTVWSLAVQNGRIYAGVRPAGLFVSDDQGENWSEVMGLTNHPTRGEWGGGGAGMILHHIKPHPTDPKAMWVGVSVAGVFYTADGGKSWEPRNRGTRQDYAPEAERLPEWGQCVHSLSLAAGSSDILYQQNHCGMYRSDDGGLSWISIEAGLPSSFGFPVATHPHDPKTAYLVPLNGDSDGRYMPNAKAAVWRTRDAGATWEDLRSGLPQEHAYQCVLRQAMATDQAPTAGVYFGTGSGTLYGSINEGDDWRPLIEHLPGINAVEAYAVD